MTEKLYFEKVKEDRSWYFVEYKPPIHEYKFATLSVVVPGNASKRRVAKAMERELRSWLMRYPIPIMVTAFDATDSVIQLKGVRPINSLIGFLKSDGKTVKAEWRLLADEELPNDALDTTRLRQIHADVPVKTGEELERAAENYRRQLKIGWTVVFVWAVIVPAVTAILEWWSDLLGVVVMVYSFGKAFVKGMRLTGRWPKSPREIEKEKEEARMRHHHYHCEQNPEGFARLKAENFEREARERTLREAEALKRHSGVK